MKLLCIDYYIVYLYYSNNIATSLNYFISKLLLHPSPLVSILSDEKYVFIPNDHLFSLGNINSRNIIIFSKDCTNVSMSIFDK